MRILVVEDDPILTRRMQRILSEHGHSPTVAASFQQAMELGMLDNIDCAIVDWQLPDGNGLDLLRAIREHFDGHYIYLIMLTSMTGIEHRREGMAAGADDFLNKPLQAEELLQRLRVALRITTLQHELADRNFELTQTKKRLEEDLDSAAKVQRDLLPPEDFTFSGMEVNWHLRSCDALGGDLVSLIPIDENQLGFAVIDVVGHGAKAAILGVQISRRFRSAWAKYGGNIPMEIISDPSRLAQLLNTEFPMDYRNLQFFTMCYGVIDRLDGRCRYVGCGHPAPIHVRASGEASFLPVDGHPIGIMSDEEASFAAQEFTLNSGDSLILYSDGLPECINGEGAMLGSTALLKAVSGETRSSRQLAVLFDQGDQWRGIYPQQDDCTALVIQRL